MSVAVASAASATSASLAEEEPLVLPIDIGDGQIPLSIGFSELDDLRRRAYFRGESDAELESAEKDLLRRLGVDEPMKDWIAPHLPSFFMNLQNCQTPLQMQLSSKCSLNQLVLWNILFADTAATRSRLKADRDLSSKLSGIDLATKARALRALRQPFAQAMSNSDEEKEEDFTRLFTLVPVVAAVEKRADNSFANSSEEARMIDTLFTLRPTKSEM
jgi:hypothetical protein